MELRAGSAATSRRPTNADALVSQLRHKAAVVFGRDLGIAETEQRGAVPNRRVAHESLTLAPGSRLTSWVHADD